MNSSSPPGDPPPRDPLDDLERDDKATLADLAAVLSTALPQIEPAALVFSGIRSRIHPAPAVRRRMVAVSAGGWAAAAVLAFSTLYFYQRAARSERELSAARGDGSGSAGFPSGPASLRNGSRPGRSAPGSTAPGTALADGTPEHGNPPEGFLQPGSGTKTYVLVQDLEKLKADLAHLQKAHSARFDSQPGLARMVLVEMGDPAQPTPPADQKSLLTERAGDALAAGLNKSSSTTSPGTAPPTPTQLSGTGAAWDKDISIENGMVPLSRLNLDPGQVVKHRNFPVNEAARYGLESLDNGYFYDAHNQFVWRPSADGQGYVGWRDEGFNPDDYRSGASGFPPPPPTLETDNLSSTEAPTPPDAAAGSSARAFTLFDETTGGGSIILHNLPSPGDGAVYQLWLTDPANPEPISVGLLPPLETGTERVYFEFGKPGIAPGGYLLTREPVGGSRQPGRDVILRGP